MTEYKCIKGFSLELCDDDGFCTEEFAHVEENTIWHTPEEENYRFIGGDIRLEIDDDKELSWIEIASETLGEYFERVR